MAKINDNFMFTTLEPSLIIDLCKVLADLAREGCRKRLSELEAQVAEPNQSPEDDWKPSEIESLRAEIALEFPDVVVRLTGYNEGSRNVVVNPRPHDREIDPVLDGYEDSPAGMAEWVGNTDIDSYQLELKSNRNWGLGVTFGISGYKPGGHLSVEVDDSENTVESRAAANAVFESVDEIASAFSTKESNAEFKVFLGHGHGSDWKVLKDTLERAGYPVMAFESMPRAGDVNINVIEASIRSSNAAVLHLTPDDEVTGGKKRGRQNVVHEIGFAQGALGVRQVVIVQHVGAESFSNLDGVSVIRYESNSLYDKLEDLVANMNEIRARGGNYGYPYGGH